jgi:hypothetical protein
MAGLSGFALSAICLAAASAQGLDGQRAGSIEFRLRADRVEQGTQPTFHLFLVNQTDHDLYIPLPTPNCSDDYDGSFELVRDFKPLGGRAKPTGPGGGCALDKFGWPPIMDRIRDEEWKILHSGDALTLDAERSDPGDRRRTLWEIVPSWASPKQPGMVAFERDSKPGTYEVWADYSPPSLDISARKTLQEWGIDYPHDRLTSNHLSFVKRK